LEKQQLAWQSHSNPNGKKCHNDRDRDKDVERSENFIDTSAINVSDADLKEAVDAWNTTAEVCRLPKVQMLTDTRRQRLAERLNDCGGMVGWREAMTKIEASDFLRGGGRNGWCVTFDYLMKPDNLAKVMEGAYRLGGAQSFEAERANVREGVASRLNGYPEDDL